MEAEVRVRDAVRQLLDLCEEIRRDGDAMIASHRFPEAAAHPADQLALRIQHEGPALRACTKIRDHRGDTAIDVGCVIADGRNPAGRAGRIAAIRGPDREEQVPTLQAACIADGDRPKLVTVLRAERVLGDGNHRDPIRLVLCLQLCFIGGTVHTHRDRVVLLYDVRRGEHQKLVTGACDQDTGGLSAGLHLHAEHVGAGHAALDLDEALLRLLRDMLERRVQLLVIRHRVRIICELLPHDVLDRARLRRGTHFRSLYHFCSGLSDFPGCPCCGFCFRWSTAPGCTLLRKCSTALRGGLFRFQDDSLALHRMQALPNLRLQATEDSGADGTKQKCGNQHTCIVPRALLPVSLPTYDIFFDKVFFCHSTIITMKIFSRKKFAFMCYTDRHE